MRVCGRVIVETHRVLCSICVGVPLKRGLCHTLYGLGHSGQARAHVGNKFGYHVLAAALQGGADALEHGACELTAVYVP